MRPIDQLGMGPQYKTEQLPDKNYKVTVTPPSWSKAGPGASIVLTPAQYVKFIEWRERRILIQDALPELRNWEREILMTGIGPAEWDRIFPKEEE